MDHHLLGSGLDRGLSCHLAESGRGVDLVRSLAEARAIWAFPATPDRAGSGAGPGKRVPADQPYRPSDRRSVLPDRALHIDPDLLAWTAPSSARRERVRALGPHRSTGLGIVKQLALD